VTGQTRRGASFPARLATASSACRRRRGNRLSAPLRRTIARKLDRFLARARRYLVLGAEALPLR